MYEELNAQELKKEKKLVQLKLETQEYFANKYGFQPDHDKLYCLYRWQLGEIEKREAAMVDV